VLPRFLLTHLWFLYVLVEFYAAMLLLRSGVVWLDRSGRFRTSVDRLIAQVTRSPLAPAILAAPIGIALSLDPTWVGWFGVRTPGESLLTNLQALIGFGTVFGFGWLLHRQIDLLRILEKRWPIHLAFAIGLIAMSFLVALWPALSIRSIPISIDTRLLRAGDLDNDFRGNRPRATLHVRLQPHAALPRRRILLALSDPHADCGGAAGRGVPSTGAGRSSLRPFSSSLSP
jgi:hypothetical protein